MMKIAVAGGTGVVGAYVVETAREVGHETVTLSRSRGVDLRNLEGLDDALANVNVIIDVANSSSLSGGRATSFFELLASNLQAAGSRSGVAHYVLLSIVGIDRVPHYGYYAAKRAQESATTSGDIPVSIVRATQFHEFGAQIMARSKVGPFVLVPSLPVKSIAARSVSEVLVETAMGLPLDSILEIAGPDVVNLADECRELAKLRGRSERVIAIRPPGRSGRAMRSGALIPNESVRMTGPGFIDWLHSPDGQRAIGFVRSSG